MKHVITALLAGALALPVLPAVAQSGAGTVTRKSSFAVRGRVLDAVSGETLPGASVQLTGNGQNTGASADVDGNYKIENLLPGTYTLQASFVGYAPLTQQVKITGQNVVASFPLKSDDKSLDEVQVVATLAQERSTPVAFSAVNEVKLRETLSSRDLPLILNETPGVYATQGGGGTGDSRITVRGFDQRNVAVLVNGVPVNDMETGQVFWSNWDLGDVTKSLQVQRGLSASKIAVPAVGGTINVLTKGFDDKRSVLARAETGFADDGRLGSIRVGSNAYNYQKYSLMLSSGMLKGDWAFTVYGSRRTSNGWVDKAYDDAWTYFGNISKRIGNHRLSLTGLGSPQSHGQRAFPSQVGVFSTDKAREIGADPVIGGDKGYQFNPYWNTLRRYTVDASGTRHYQAEEVLNERANYYHKPQINLNDFWQINERLFLSTVVYASYGSGGGVAGLNGATSSSISRTGLLPDFQKIYDTNYANVGADGTRRSTQILVNNVNSHRWYGFVTGADYNISDKLTFSAGVDGRTYKGIHYRQVRDLLGGDYATNPGDRNAFAGTRLGVGDKLGFNYEGQTRWLGGYSQLEYKTPLFSAVVSATASEVGYKRIDYFQPKQLTVNGTTYSLPYNSFTDTNGGDRVVTFNNQRYTTADANYVTTPWARFTGYTVKGGANYNFTEHDNVFFNVGYNNRVPLFNQVYDANGILYRDVRPEGISSYEIGYGITYPSMKATLNAYYTLWANKATNSTSNTTGELLYSTVRNVDARHMGVELSVAQEISRRLQLNAAISLGDWRWIGKGLLTVTNEANVVQTLDAPVFLDGVHVGDAAQNQFQLSLRYEPVRNFYIRPSFLLFTKYYADFNPESIRDENFRTDSYRLPTSRNLDLHFGYEVPPLAKGQLRFGLRASILNLLNEYYFTDVANISNVNVPTPNQVQAFFNRGRMYTVGISATL